MSASQGHFSRRYGSPGGEGRYSSPTNAVTRSPNDERCVQLLWACLSLYLSIDVLAMCTCTTSIAVLHVWLRLGIYMCLA